MLFPGQTEPKGGRKPPLWCLPSLIDEWPSVAPAYAEYVCSAENWILDRSPSTFDG